jgi:hypothetical protein
MTGDWLTGIAGPLVQEEGLTGVGIIPAAVGWQLAHVPQA